MTSDLMGAVTIKWAHVKSISTAEPVTVVLPGGKTVEGKIETSGDQVQVAGQTAPLPSVNTVRSAAEQAKYNRYLHPPLWDLWSGFYDFGIADASGNSESLSITNSISAARITSNDKLSINVNQIYAKGEVNNKLGLTAQSFLGGWEYDHNVNKRTYLSIFDNYSTDKFQDLRFRGVFGGGAGFHAVATANTKFDLAAGFSLDHESYSVNLAPAGAAPFESRNVGEFYWGDDLNWKMNKLSVFTQGFRMYDDVGGTSGQYRVKFDLGMVTKISKWLSWQLTASDRYISNPAPGRKTNDLLVSSGIRLTFTQLPQ
jgi:putative salt-induced outer membrane protein YdiY